MTATETKDTVPLGQYLFQRLKQSGIANVFGVPGDFNLQLLDYVYKVKDVNWVGCCNELNAAYAADGYSRIKRGPAALVTTYGVGELSALNGISGSYAESVPVIHIVGTTARPTQDEQWLLHHVSPGQGLNKPNHMIYGETSKPFACAHEWILDPKKAAEQIDHVIAEVTKRCVPGYLYIPTDMVHKGMPNSRLQTPLDVEHRNDESKEDALVSEILEGLYKAEKPIVLGDILSYRWAPAQDLIKELLQKAPMWSFTTPLGKGVIDESDPTFVSVYNGTLSGEGVPEAVHSSDFVLNVGPLLSDSNTGGFTRQIKDENAVLLHPNYISVKGKIHEGIHFGGVLKKLVARIDGAKVKPLGDKPQVGPLKDEPTKHISQDYLLKAVERFIQPHDILIAESGTFQFSAPLMKFKEGCTYFSQIFYSSIGFALPAAFGAGIAHRELGLKGRVVLVEGDGSAQMTIQELGSMVRHKLPITIFLLNNDGYSIERAIWGPEQDYNDICPNWKYTKLLSAFGGEEGTNVNSTLVRTRQDMEDLLANGEFTKSTATKTSLVEVILDPFDYPWILKGQVKIMGGKNIQAFKEYAAARNED